MTVVMFFIGLIAGGMIGVVTMCCLQASKNREQYAKQNNLKRKEK